MTTVTTLFNDGPWAGSMVPLRFEGPVPHEVKFLAGTEPDEKGRVLMDQYRLVSVEEAPYPMRGLVAFAVFQAQVRALPGSAHSLVE